MNNLVGLVIRTLNFPLLMAVGLDLTPLDLTRVRRQSALVSVGLLAPLVLLPPRASIERYQAVQAAAGDTQRPTGS